MGYRHMVGAGLRDAGFVLPGPVPAAAAAGTAPTNGTATTDAAAAAVAVASATTAAVAPAAAVAAAATPASVVSRGPHGRSQVALTFDGAYSLKESLAVLAALRREQAPATLFLIGNSLNAYPTMTAEIVAGVAAGLFEVADHSWSHPHLPQLSNEAIAREIGAGADAFRAATGVRTVPLFRPPYGETNSRVAAVAGSRGYPYVVLWSIDTLDWKDPPASSIAQRVFNAVHPGAIVLMHLSGKNTAAALPTIVRGLRERGYELVTVSALLKGAQHFLDVPPGSEVDRAVSRLVGAGIVNGYDANYFGPADPLTRAQAAKIVSFAAGLEVRPPEEYRPTFRDVSLARDVYGNALSYPLAFVEAAAAAGLVVGRTGGEDGPLFDPEAPVTRVQLAQMVARMVRNLGGDAPYAPEAAGAPTLLLVDVPLVDVPAHATEDVALVARLGLMMGYAGGRFDPYAEAQRGHVALVINRYLDWAATAGMR